MDFSHTETQTQIRSAVKALCDGFGPEYWRQCAQDGAYPEEYGGSGLSLMDACPLLEEVNRNGGNSASCHAQMYTMASIMRHGSEFDIERKWKESRLRRTAPISNNLVLAQVAEHLPGMSRSY